MERVKGRSIRGFAGDRRDEQLAAHDLATPRTGDGYLRSEGEARAHDGATVSGGRAVVTVQFDFDGPVIPRGYSGRTKSEQRGRQVRLILLAILSAALALPAAADEYAFTTIDAPGASFGTFLFAINDSGTVIGRAQSTNSLESYSFTYSGGAFTPFELPGSSPTSTGGYGINNAGYRSGEYQDFPSTGVRGFIETAGGFQAVDVPGAKYTAVWRMNDVGAAVGTYNDATTTAHGFLLEGGLLTTIDVPGAGYTTLQDINDHGVMVGTYGMPNQTSSGFVFDGSIFTTVHFPGAERTLLSGINNDGTIVGAYYLYSGDGPHAFVKKGDVYVDISHPLATTFTFVTDINNNGSLVGQYNDGEGYNEDTHGFIAHLRTNPGPIPEPSTWAILILGFFLAGTRLRRRLLTASRSGSRAWAG
jgi:hypothetical protein